MIDAGPLRCQGTGFILALTRMLYSNAKQGFLLDFGDYSMAKKEDIYQVTVEGQYYSLAEGRKAIKPYRFTFKAPASAKKLGLLSVFRNHMRPKDGQETELLRQMQEQYPDYKQFRTHVVTETINLTTQKPIQELALWNRQQIIAYIDKAGIPIESELYPSIPDLRQALKDFNDNPDVFIKNQEKRRATRGPELQVMRAIADLNRKAPEPYTPPLADPGYDPYASDDDDIAYEDDPLRLPEFDDQNELAALVAGI